MLVGEADSNLRHCVEIISTKCRNPAPGSRSAPSPTETDVSDGGAAIVGAAPRLPAARPTAQWASPLHRRRTSSRSAQVARDREAGHVAGGGHRPGCWRGPIGPSRRSSPVCAGAGPTCRCTCCRSGRCWPSAGPSRTSAARRPSGPVLIGSFQRERFYRAERGPVARARPHGRHGDRVRRLPEDRRRAADRADPAGLGRPAAAGVGRRVRCAGRRGLPRRLRTPGRRRRAAPLRSGVERRPGRRARRRRHRRRTRRARRGDGATDDRDGRRGHPAAGRRRHQPAISYLDG